MESGTRFQPVLADPSVEPHSVRRVAILTGKLYYDLVKERQAANVDDVAFVRVEELSPFPFHELESTLAKYSNADEFVWVQEEPRNQGAWTHVEPRIRRVMEDMGLDCKLEYVGRREAAVPATGVGKFYKRQQEALIKGVFEGRKAGAIFTV